MGSSVVEKIKGFIPKSVTMDQAKDTGMAMTLIALLIGFFGNKPPCFAAAIVLLLANMTFPGLYRPVARLWFGLSHALGTVMSKIILSILFFALVTPVGLIRKLSGKDSLQLKKWKQDRSSVFKVRDHRFTSKDIEHPY